MKDIVSREKGRAEGGDPRWAERLPICEPCGGEEIVLGARKALATIPIKVARGEPARDGEIEHDVPGAGTLSVLVALIAEFDGGLRDEFLGDGAETDGRVACFLRDKLGLSLEGDDERPEENADGTASFEQRLRGSQGKGYVAGKGISRSTET
jgi:hypothetical protein